MHEEKKRDGETMTMMMEDNVHRIEDVEKRTTTTKISTTSSSDRSAHTRHHHSGVLPTTSTVVAGRKQRSFSSSSSSTSSTSHTNSTHRLVALPLLRLSQLLRLPGLKTATPLRCGSLFLAFFVLAAVVWRVSNTTPGCAGGTCASFPPFCCLFCLLRFVACGDGGS